LVLAVASLGMLIYFIDHVSSSLQADRVAATVNRELEKVITCTRRNGLAQPDSADPRHPGRLRGRLSLRGWWTLAGYVCLGIGSQYHFAGGHALHAIEFALVAYQTPGTGSPHRLAESAWHLRRRGRDPGNRGRNQGREGRWARCAEDLAAAHALDHRNRAGHPAAGNRHQYRHLLCANDFPGGWLPLGFHLHRRDSIDRRGEPDRDDHCGLSGRSVGAASAPVDLAGWHGAGAGRPRPDLSLQSWRDDQFPRYADRDQPDDLHRRVCHRHGAGVLVVNLGNLSAERAWHGDESGNSGELDGQFLDRRHLPQLCQGVD
ncbi:MAG: DUF2254 domain-containing protein, partial [Ktedonobacteraceae bacterium]|nr:DUF2254 domain-containing protein [Ktedonobacteraceae bacterium]